MAGLVSWSVGSILNESLKDTLQFAAWYLEAGADQLVLMFDDPEDAAIDILDRKASITCIPCTDVFWETLGLTRETRFTRRQNAALSWAYGQAGTDWFLNVDGDEFLFLRDGPVSGFLAAQPNDVEAVRVETAEIVASHSPVDASFFRLPMHRRVARRVYGEDFPLFGPRRQGLVGHADGKSCIRTGLAGVQLRQHWAQRGKDRVSERLVGRAEGAYLLHFIGLDYPAWRAKVDWRSASRGFTAPLTERIQAALSGQDPEGALRSLHERLHSADAQLLLRLREEQSLLSLELSMRDLLERHFEGAA